MAIISPDLLRSTLREGYGTLELQPIFDLTTGQVVIHEVLLRLLDARGDELLPKEFIPTAVEFNMLPEIDFLALRLLEDQAKILKNEPPTRLSLNISRRTLAYQPYIDKLISSAWQNIGKSLMFEVKSSDIGQDVEAIKTMRRLKGVGICLCVDYQKGGAKVVELAKGLGFDYLKINAVGISSTFTDSELKDVMAACAAARKDDFKVIFERVETETDYKAIKKLSPQYAQGFLFGLPKFEFVTKDLPPKLRVI